MPYLLGLVSCEQDDLRAGRRLLALIDDLIQPRCGSDQVSGQHRRVPPSFHHLLTLP
jgi:hypothetical protein